MLLEYCVFKKISLLNVFSVAKTPIFFVFVSKIAGFIPGSIPIIGQLKSFLNDSIEFVVAVLQAIIMILQSSLISSLQFLVLSSVIIFFDLFP